ncbi:hypothetical protein FH128_01815 [Staphylococcus hominis]|uniref:hypothetical protein n=1 Tax=Staphylococcus hominis TaxID=1290 RepID=UPI001F575DCF|nr:hypothetical protein [Staphylococcus hominis]MCI2898670.1 hypothetical protein [Staphylococcus hominis]
MVTIDNIKQILECSDIYAQKLIRWANGDEEALSKLINHKLEERRKREAVVEYGH